MVGRKFGRWTVLSSAGRNNHSTPLWKLSCNCGTIKIMEIYHLLSGESKSCGCYNRELFIKRNRKHGMAIKSRINPTYITWKSMIQRCINSKHSSYKYYGGRGIKVCKRWMKSKNFLADMGKRPKGKTIDRVNPNGNYELENCRWATPKEQATNRRKRGL